MEKNKIHKKNHRTRSLQRDQTFRLTPNTFIFRPNTTHVTDLESVLSCFFRVIAYENVWAQWLHLKGWHFLLRPDTTHVTDLESWFRLIGGNFTTLPQVKIHLPSKKNLALNPSYPSGSFCSQCDCPTNCSTSKTMDTSQSTLGRCSTGARQHQDQGSIKTLKLNQTTSP